MTELMMAMYLEPDTVKALLEKCTEFILRYCQAIKKTGAAGVVMAEPGGRTPVQRRLHDVLLGVRPPDHRKSPG